MTIEPCLRGKHKQKQLENLLGELVEWFEDGLLMVSGDASLQQSTDITALIDEAVEVLALDEDGQEKEEDD